VGEKAFKSFTPEDLKNGCFYYNMSSVKTPVYGYGKVFVYQLYPNQARPGVVDWTTEPDANGNRGNVRV
jgi:hypothetical protein